MLFWRDVLRLFEVVLRLFWKCCFEVVVFEGMF